MEENRTQKQCIQAVFLIDTRKFHENDRNRELVNKAFRATSTSVLRLLTYLVNRLDCDKAKFVWGHQFFKIPLKSHIYAKRSVFREFSRSTYADFENQLRQEINIGTGQSIFNSKVKQNPTREAAAEISPAFSLKYALHDASLDYRWDELIIASPVKSAFRKRHKENEINQVPTCALKHQQTKFVFVLLPCPLTENDLEEFTENEAPFDPCSLKKTLINTGRQESSLFDHHGASLFWLDTRNLWQRKSATSKSGGEQAILDHDGYNLIDETLALVKGCIIPLSSLTNFATSSAANIRQFLVERPTVVAAGSDVKPHLASVTKSASSDPNQKPLSDTHAPRATAGRDASTEEEHKASKDPFSGGDVVLARRGISSTVLDSPALPYTSFLDHITQNKLSKSADSAVSDSVRLVQLCTSTTGEETTVKCILKLQLLWKSPSSRFPCSQVTKQGEPSTTNSLMINTVDGALTIPIHSAAHSSPASDTGSDVVSPPDESRGQHDEVPQGSILGAVPRGLLTLDLYQSSEVYSCLGYDMKAATGGTTSTWFQALLLSLSHNNLLMVVELFERFAVLEPLTPVMGTLRVIDSTRMAAMERVVAFDGVPITMGDLGDGELDPGSRTMRKLHQGATSGETPGQSKPTRLSLDLHKSTKSLKTFSSNCLEPWYQDLPQRGVTAKFLEQLVRIPEKLLIDDSVNLDSALIQLKSLYRTGGSASPTTQKDKDEDTTVKAQDGPKVEADAKLTEQQTNIMRKCTARTRSILENSRKVETQTPQDSPKRKKTKTKGSTQMFIPDKDFSSLQDLQSYVEDAYNSATARAASSLSCAQQIVFLTVHFMKEQSKNDANDDVSNTVKHFLRDSLLRSNPDLIKKYQAPELEQEARVKEAKLQALLRLEIEVAFPSEVKDLKVKGQTKVGQDDESDQSVFNSSAEDTDSELPEEVQEIVDEISQLLSSIPLLADHDQLLSFLDDDVLPSYSDTIPYMVKAVFEELGHPIPADLLSPASSKVSSVKPPLSHSSVRSWGSVDAAPASFTRSRTMIRHPSLADASHKRIIPIQAKRVKTKKLPTKKEDSDTEAKKAKRNLFSDNATSAGGSRLTRRESVAVMQGISKPRRQSPRKHPQGPSRVLKTRTVKETPGKRQVSQAVLCNVNRARKLEARLVGKPLSPMIEVIEESPVKPLASSAPQTFPRHLTKNLSFYSQDKGKTTKRALQEARRLTARITGSSPEGVVDIASRVQLMKSPARSLLKDVCTPSTLGSLSRLRSGHVTPGSGDGGSPNLKPTRPSGESEDTPNAELLLSPPRQKTRSVQETPLKESNSGTDASLCDSKVQVLSSPVVGTRSAPKKKAAKSSPVQTNLKQMISSPAMGTRSATKAASAEVVESVTESSSSSDATLTSGDDDVSQQQPPPGLPGNGTPRKRKALRTSLKTMFDGVAQNTFPSDHKVGAGSRKRRRRNVLEEADNRFGEDTELEQGTSQIQKELGSSLGSPLKKRQRTAIGNKPKFDPDRHVPKSSTPSPKRKKPTALASPDIFQQWPRRKLRSTPSPNSHFVRGSQKKSPREAGTRTKKSPANPSLKTTERSLRKRSKTCLKFPAIDGSSQDKKAEQMGGMGEDYFNEMDSGKENIPGMMEQKGMGDLLDIGLAPVRSKDSIRSYPLKRETSAEELERHFSFHSDDDEIEFVKVDRSTPTGRPRKGEDDSQSSPVFSGNSSDMKSPDNLRSPFRSPRLQRKAPKETTSDSPVFEYVSTPNSAGGLKLTIHRQRSTVSTGSIVPSSVSPYAAASTESSSIPGAGDSSTATSENDDVFSSLCEERPQSTPPRSGSSRKVNCNLSTKGLYGLLHSPFAGSPGRRLGSRDKPVSISRRNSQNVVSKKE